jgi:putative DNA primase/helicase
LTNELPRLADASGALASRFVVLVLQNSFYGRENPRLTEELLAESPGIFAWALEGLDRLRARGCFATPPSSRDALRQLEDLGSPTTAFVRDRCVLHADGRVAVDDLWAAWREWCAAESHPPGSKAVFGRDVRAALPTVQRSRHTTAHGKRAYAYTGIRLIDGDEEQPDVAADVPPREEADVYFGD